MIFLTIITKNLVIELGGFLCNAGPGSSGDAKSVAQNALVVGPTVQPNAQ